MNLQKNVAIELVSVKAPNLVSLNLSHNLIEKTENFEGHPRLRVLELRGNKLATCQNISNMPELKELYLVCICSKIEKI